MDLKSTLGTLGKRKRKDLHNIPSKHVSTKDIQAKDLQIDVLRHRKDVTYRLALVLFQSFKHIHSPAKQAPTLVVGPNGTGKTESIGRIARAFHQLFQKNQKEFDYVYLNGQSHKERPFSAFAEALDSLPLQLPHRDEKECRTSVQQHHFRQHILLVLDEIDSFDSATVHLLLNMTHTKNGRRIVIVVISNNPQFAQSKLHEATVSRLGKSTITFPAYTSDELFDILKGAASPTQQDDDTLRFLARSYTAKSFGARDALSFLSRGASATATAAAAKDSDHTKDVGTIDTIDTVAMQQAQLQTSDPRHVLFPLLPFYQTVIWHALCKLHQEDQYMLGYKTEAAGQGYQFRLGRVHAKFTHLVQTVPHSQATSTEKDFNEAILALVTNGLIQVLLVKSGAGKSLMETPMLYTNIKPEHLPLVSSLVSFFCIE